MAAIYTYIRGESMSESRLLKIKTLESFSPKNKHIYTTLYHILQSKN
jgi:hypothetical protein